MARPSKVKSPKHAKFEVYTDENDPTTHSLHQRNVSNDGDVHENDAEDDGSAFAKDMAFEGIDDIMEQDAEYDDENGSILDDIEASLLELPANTPGEQTESSTDADDECRRESVMTTASISSMPESTVFDGDHGAARFPYTPQSARPTLRHPDSLQRMRSMGSPASFERSPKRKSVLHGRSRTGTPRSARKARQQEEDKKQDFPLVLLHLTLLPIPLRWSEASMQELLPPGVLKNLHLLRSRVSDTILQRGILVPHPKGEYELLEERLLEALELKEERITKCGHFRGASTSSSEGEGSVHSAADSGVDISPPGADADICRTCFGPVKSASATTASDGSKWSIKIYAANGLMRSSAWAAAWSEMERVDVEILPWISEELCKALDAAAEREEEEDEQARIKTLVEEQVRLAHARELGKRAEEQSRLRSTEYQLVDHRSPPHATPSDPLPQVYKPADIPLSILLRNYIYLLARDKRNVAIFVLAILAVWLSLGSVQRPAVIPGIQALTPVLEDSAISIMPKVEASRVVEVFPSVAEPSASMTSAVDSVAKSVEALLQVEDDIAAFMDERDMEPDVSGGICRNPMATTELFGRT